MDHFRAQIRAAIARHTDLDAAEIRIENPREASHGDLAFPSFALAKQRGAPPPKVAAELAERLAPDLTGIDVRAVGPFLNFTIARGELARWLFGALADPAADFGSSELGRGKTVVIDLSSPNIAKPMHVGHLRSTILGAAIQRLHDLCGYRTVGINHIGDWGSQFGKLAVAIERWGAEVDLAKQPIRGLLALYVKYHDEEERDASLGEAAAAAFRELESGVDGPVRAIWRRVTELSLQEFDKIYRRLGVSFDVVQGEAFYEPYLDATIERIVAAGVTEESQGALIVDLEPVAKNMPPCLLRKTDGTTLYATRDLAAAFHRWDTYAFDRCLYVVGSDQKLHFRQLFGVLERMGLAWHARMEHVAFGMLRLPEGRLQTRKGRVVFLEEVLDTAVSEARRVILEKNPELPDLEQIAEEVGVGAVVFNDLKRERVKDIEFDWAEVVSFEGDTGPYLQYTHARLASIARKAVLEGHAGDLLGAALGLDLGVLADAGGVLVRLARFPDAVQSAALHAEPSEVSSYLLALAREVNSWLASERVLGQETAVTAPRLALCHASKCVLGKGLRLLGIAAPEEM